MAEDNEGLKDLVKKLVEQNEQLIANKETKKWKLPGKAKVNKAKARKGWASFLVLRHNGEVTATRAPIDDEGTVMIEGFPRIATTDYRLVYKGKPMYIIPEWSLRPISPVDNYEETEKEKMNMAGRRLVLARMQREIIKPKKDFGGLVWVLVIMVVVAAGYLLYKNGGKIF